MAISVSRTIERMTGVMSIDHTHVPAPLEGRGIAAALVAATLAHARAQGLRVRPVCSYVAAYMRRRPRNPRPAGGVK